MVVKEMKGQVGFILLCTVEFSFSLLMEDTMQGNYQIILILRVE